MNYQTRKLPKKTVIMISILIALGVIIFVTMQSLKNEKFNEVLADLGYKDIKSLKVVNRLNVEDTVTKQKSYAYKLAFYDKNTNKECIGFVFQQKDKSFTQDIDCK